MRNGMGRMRSRWKIVVVSLLVVIVYNESVGDNLQTWHWPSLPVLDHSIRILLVADPQIVGEKFEPGFPLGSFTRWDCDRFLSKMFSRAMDHVIPDVVVFLGDLIDEGSVASEEEYRRYVKRFWNIFYVPHNIKAMFLPGDNDIGGEGSDRVTDEKVNRFSKAFIQQAHVKLKFLDFYSVNRLTHIVHAFPHPVLNTTRIVLSHLPIVPLPGPFVTQVISSISPHLIFSAHDHKSMHFVADIHSGQRLGVETFLERQGPIWSFQLGADEELHEIMIPTCSYRMGTPHMGYGAAVIDANGELHYAVLWLPSRFQQLFLYLGTLVVVLLMLFVIQCCHVCKLSSSYRLL